MIGEAGDASGLVFDATARPLAFSDEMTWLLDGLPADASFDPDDALAAAAEAFVAVMADLMGTVEGPAASATILVGDTGTALAPGQALTVGRHGDIILDHRLVSRRHLVVQYDADGLTCRDLGSANGTWVIRDDARSPVDEAGCILMAGDRVVTVQDHELFSVAAVG